MPRFERLEKLLVADLAGEYKRRGFPYADDLPRETIVSTLKEPTALFQELFHMFEAFLMRFYMSLYGNYMI